MGKFITTAIVEQAIQLRRSGVTIGATAKQLGISVASVLAATKGKVPNARRGRNPKAAGAPSPIVTNCDDMSLSNRYPRHEDRIAAHTKRIHEYLIANPEDNSQRLRDVLQDS
jgi:hypothetical protein